MSTILVADDDVDVLKAAQLALSQEGHDIVAVSSIDDLERMISARRYDVALLDMNFRPTRRDGGEGLDLIARVRAADPATSVVLMTAYGGVELAVSAFKRGANDFILKPWAYDKLLATVAAAAQAAAARRGSVVAPPSTVSEEVSMLELERSAVEQALARADGNISRAAASLGLSRQSFYRRLQKYCN